MLVVLRELSKSRFAHETVFLSIYIPINCISKISIIPLYLISNLLQDFGDSIPGHGGITDRMDCQVNFAKL